MAHGLGQTRAGNVSAHPSGLRRMGWLGWTVVLTLIVSALKIIEDVVGRESGPFDEALLWFVRAQVPSTWTAFFAAVTLSGSATLIVPTTAAIALALWLARRRAEATLVTASSISGALFVYVLKALIGRERPALWDAQWYWGSSFPSGHTLSAAAFATAAALCVARIWPRWAHAAMVLALAWSLTVALSRLVLGVHWPTDVLVALCIGVLIPLLISAAQRTATTARASVGAAAR